MAIRTVRVMGDELLTHISKEVKAMTPRTKVLIEDMLETMYEEEGVGLAAPQVGVLKRIAVIDVTEDRDQPIVLINPEILETSGEQTAYEGCLSVPGKVGKVTRPNYCRIKAMNEDMEEVVLEGEGLLARAMLHEVEHLDGELFVSHVAGGVTGLVDNSEFEQED